MYNVDAIIRGQSPQATEEDRQKMRECLVELRKSTELTRKEGEALPPFPEEIWRTTEE
jgi:hypothetical protein